MIENLFGVDIFKILKIFKHTENLHCLQHSFICENIVSFLYNFKIEFPILKNKINNFKCNIDLNLLFNNQIIFFFKNNKTEILNRLFDNDSVLNINYEFSSILKVYNYGDKNNILNYFFRCLYEKKNIIYTNFKNKFVEYNFDNCKWIYRHLSDKFDNNLILLTEKQVEIKAIQTSRNRRKSKLVMPKIFTKEKIKTKNALKRNSFNLPRKRTSFFYKSKSLNYNTPKFVNIKKPNFQSMKNFKNKTFFKRKNRNDNLWTDDSHYWSNVDILDKENTENEISLKNCQRSSQRISKEIEISKVPHQQNNLIPFKQSKLENQKILTSSRASTVIPIRVGMPTLFTKDETKILVDAGENVKDYRTKKIDQKINQRQNMSLFDLLNNCELYGSVPRIYESNLNIQSSPGKFPCNTKFSTFKPRKCSKLPNILHQSVYENVPINPYQNISLEDISQNVESCKNTPPIPKNTSIYSKYLANNISLSKCDDVSYSDTDVHLNSSTLMFEVNSLKDKQKYPKNILEKSYDQNFNDSDHNQNMGNKHEDKSYIKTPNNSPLPSSKLTSIYINTPPKKPPRKNKGNVKPVNTYSGHLID